VKTNHHDAADDENRLQSRRSLLTGGVATVGALFLLVFGRVPAASAGSDGDVVLGEVNAETSATEIRNDAQAGTAFVAAASGGFATALRSVVSGPASHAIDAECTDTDGLAVNAAGGNGSSGMGIKGTAGGVGVYGLSDLGTAVLGVTGEGIGVFASAKTTGTALHVHGKTLLQGTTAFTRSGVATVPEGAQETTVRISDLTNASFVLATLQDVVDHVVVEAVSLNPSANEFTIRLSGPVSGPARVAWLVLDSS